ncbi:MAG: FixH family protein [Myxococcota bacterium]
MRAAVLSSVLFLGLVACDEEPAPAAEQWTVDCTGAQAFQLGMTVTSPAGVTVALEDAAPAPLDVGDNAWTLSVTDAGGAPLTGLTPLVRPWMPLHGHGVSPTHYPGEEVADGVYQVEIFDVIMPGLWEFHVELNDQGDEATFALCAEG